MLTTKCLKKIYPSHCFVLDNVSHIKKLKLKKSQKLKSSKKKKLFFIQHAYRKYCHMYIYIENIQLKKKSKFNEIKSKEICFT